MTPVDDLAVGMFVAISDYHGELPCDPWTGQCVPVHPPHIGRPHKIVALSLPFVCLDDGRSRCSIDLRLWSLRKVSARYARAFYELVTQREREDKPASIFRKSRKKKPKPDPRDCPRCGSPHTVQRLKVVGQGNWRRHCKACGWNDDEPGSQSAAPIRPDLLK